MNRLSLTKTLKPIFALTLSACCLVSFNSAAIDIQQHQNGYVQYHENEHHQERNKAKFKVKLKRLAKYLKLSEQQRSDLRELFIQQKENRVDRRELMAEHKNQIQQLLLAEEFDEIAFKEIFKNSDALAQVAMQKAKMRHAMLQILTPEQQQKFLAMKEKRQKRLF